MNVKTGLTALIIGCAAAFAVPQSAQAAGYVSGGYYNGYTTRYAPRYCYDAYGYRYYCDPYDNSYYYDRPYYPYYGPSVSIGFGYRGDWDHGHNSHGNHDSHHWHH